MKYRDDSEKVRNVSGEKKGAHTLYKIFFLLLINDLYDGYTSKGFDIDSLVMSEQCIGFLGAHTHTFYGQTSGRKKKVLIDPIFVASIVKFLYVFRHL